MKILQFKRKIKFRQKFKEREWHPKLFVNATKVNDKKEN